MSNSLYSVPAVAPITTEDVAKISDKLGFKCPQDEHKEIRDKINEFLKSYDVVEKLPERLPEVKYPRTPGYRPSPQDNQHNAWTWRCDIKGETSGKLAGLKVGIKDNISVAGIPLTNGSKLLQGYVPEFDATVVTRILSEGGNITGMTTCEDFCFSGSSFFTTHGPVLNPYDKQRSAGGSSSGSCVLVSLGEVDVALAADQGGSIRIPASWCGIVGIKPTYGLVPYTGIGSIEPSIDVVGPVARTVKDCATFLEVLAGNDGLDPRQPRNLTVPKYCESLSGNISGKKLAVVKEGFDVCENEVQLLVKDTIKSLKDRGAVVDDVSIPSHLTALDVWKVICVDGFYRTVMLTNGVGTGHKGFYATSFVDTMAPKLQSEAHNIGENVKAILMCGHHAMNERHGRFYGKAQNQVPDLIKAYDEWLKEYDALVMPTLPYKPSLLPLDNSSFSERIDTAYGMVKNTAQFCITGHPALTINAGFINGLPIGMMFIGRHFDESTLFELASAVEIINDVQTM